MSQTDPPAKKTSSGTSSKNRQSSSRKPAAKKGTSKSARSKAVAEQRQKRLLYRTIRSCIYLFMAFVGTLSLFSVSGFMIDWYKYLIGSLLGYGFYLAPLAFLWAAVMIFVRMKSKVRARETAIFMIPVLFGSMGHLVRASYPIGSGMEGFKQLAETGRALTSGGVFSGGLAMLLKAALSAGGGVLLCVIAIAACLFVATGTNPVTFAKGLRPAPEEEYEEEEPARKPAKRTRIHEDTGEAPAPAQSSRHETASISHELPPRRSAPAFIDFFRKDKPQPEPAPEQPSRKDPTAPAQPAFTVEEASSLTSSSPFAGQTFDMKRILGKEPPVQAQAGPTPEPKPEAAPAPSEKTPDSAALSTPAVPPEIHISDSASAPWEDAPAAEDHSTDEPAPIQQEAPVPSPDGVQAPAAGFDIYTEDNPPPAEVSLDEKRRDAAEAHEKAAEENDVSRLLDEASKADAGKYIYPPLSLLAPGDPGMGANHESIVKCAERLVDTLKSFNIEASIVNVTKGPTVTRYELQLQRGIKFSKVTNLSDDIALSLGASSVRIAPIPANNSVGIEVPNDIQEVVSLRDILQNKAFSSAKSKLSFAVGKDIAGQCIVGNISKMPHLLIAGTTGSGKSVCINSIIISLIYKASPEEVRLIMVDPKMIELGMYNGIPHLLIPVVTDPKKAAGALNWAVGEMMRRYKLLSQLNVRNLEAYNEEIRRRGEGETLPQIVIVIDELADLMFVAAREVEESIARIAQMARAAGMHLIIATQRPSADVITGLMKANIPSRIAFAVASQIESRIILDQNGAEKLIGRGDMLYNPLGAGKPMRVQGCFISSKEVESVIDFVKTTGTPEYSQEILDHIERQANPETQTASGESPASDDSDADDPLLMDAISVVVDRGEASTSLLQRKLKLGYARAARLIDVMEERGIVGSFEGAKPRSVSLTPDQWSEMQLRMKD